MSDPLLDVLKGAVDENKTFATSSMAKLTVRFTDGKFKKVAIATGEPEMFFTGVRAGKKADYIFEFEPIDARPYAGIEMDEKQVFDMLPGFEAHIVKAMGYAPEEGQAVTFPVTFGVARAKFKKAYEAAEKARLAAEAQTTVQSEAERYANNPAWGQFA